MLNIGFWYFYAPNSKWGLFYKLDWFGITVGVGYRYFKFTAKVNKTNWNGRFDMTFQGPLFSISDNF